MTPPDYLIEQYLDEYYSSEVKVTITVRDWTDAIVGEHTGYLNILMDTMEPAGFTWTPSAEGTYTITMMTQVVDAQVLEGETREQTLQYTTTQQNRPPYFTTEPKRSIEQPSRYNFTRTYEYDADAVDPDGDTVIYSLEVAPPGMTIDGATGFISWRPNSGQVGIWDVTVRAFDQELYTDQVYTITVGYKEDPVDVYPRRTIFVKQVRMNGMPDDILKPGEQLYMSTALENIGHEDIDYVTVRATCEGLGISRKLGPYDGARKDVVLSGGVLLDIPMDAEPGYYTCRATIRTDTGMRRVEHRDIRII
jgi:hypothetical protein